MTMENTDEVGRLHKLYMQLRELSTRINLEFLKVGELVYLLSLDNTFQKLNPECASFGKFIADPKIGFSRPDACGSRRIYALFLGEHKVDPNCLSKIGKIKLTADSDSEDTEKWPE